jgi:3-hydroxy acid dehydrogenase/malonic semialdehyde reductase
VTDGAVAARAFGAEGSKSLFNARRLQLNGTGIRVTTVDPGLAETEFSVVRFKCDFAQAKKVYEGTRPLTAEDIAAKINAPLHI